MNLNLVATPEVHKIIYGTLAPYTGPTITGATNASPTVVTATAHGLSTGDALLISGVTGNTALNGLRIVTVVTVDTFTVTDFVAGTAVNGNGVTAGTIVATYVGSNITPGQCFDLLETVDAGPCKGGPFSYANRAAETAVKTILGV